LDDFLLLRNLGTTTVTDALLIGMAAGVVDAKFCGQPYTGWFLDVLNA
jgi:hypothetical protein